MCLANAGREIPSLLAAILALMMRLPSGRSVNVGTVATRILGIPKIPGIPGNFHPGILGEILGILRF